MVNSKKMFICFFCILMINISLICSKDVELNVQLDRKENFVGKPLSGTFTIQHNGKDIVDTNNVFLGKNSLKIDFVRDVIIDPSTDLVVSIYKFQIPSEESGTQVLPEISVKVGDNSYRTTPLTYVVQAPLNSTPTESPSTTTKSAITTTTTTNAPFLKLESFIEGKVPLYVGQRIRVGYRFFFNDTYDLDQIVLPLIDAKGFKKIGKERINEYTEKFITARQIDQEIEALTPGNFSFGPSYIVGSIYRTNMRGQNQLIYNNIKAEAPVVTIKVLDVPEKGKPTSFNGSIGEAIAFQVELKSPASLFVGDKVSLELNFTSKNDISNIKIPNLCCQPGFPGIYEVDDIPPIGITRGKSLVFSVGMRALSPNTLSIPSIEFSYFNPKNERYEIKKSKIIPIKVAERPKKKVESTKSQPIHWPEFSKQTKPIEIKTIYPIDRWDLQNRYFGTLKVLLILPFGILVVLLQFFLFKYRKKWIEMHQEKMSRHFLNRAKMENILPSELYYFLNLALISGLKEVGLIVEKDYTPQDLPTEGFVGEIREFLCSVDEQRFSGKDIDDKQELINKAESFLNQLIRE